MTMNIPLYNFVERRVDYLNRNPIDDIEARQYIPQTPAAFDRYQELRGYGTPISLVIDMILDAHQDGEL
jgi:hypothetical protein